MKTIAGAYLSKQGCSAQEAVNPILTELKLRSVFPATYFVNKNLCGERVKVLLSVKQLSELPDDCLNNFRKSNVHCYKDRTDKLYLGWKYSAVNDFCYAKFSAYYKCDSYK